MSDVISAPLTITANTISAPITFGGLTGPPGPVVIATNVLLGGIKSSADILVDVVTGVATINSSTGGYGNADAGKFAQYGGSGGLNCTDYIEANSASSDPSLGGGIALYHEGSVAGIYIGRGEGSVDIQIPTLTGNWTQYFQNKAGTYAMLSDIVQSDWDITDDSLPGYLKNKPTLGTVAALDYSYGGDGEDDNGKIPRYQSDGSLFVSTSLTVNGSGTGVALSPASLAFSNNGYFGQLYPPSALSGPWSWQLPDKGGAVAMLSDIPTGSAASLDAGTGASEVLQLDSGGKIPLVCIPDSLLGQVQYQSLWSALLNIPGLPDTPTSDQAGHYWICNESGNFLGTDFQVGDWIIDNSGTWGKVNNTDAVRSVAGRIGDVTLGADDISGLGSAARVDTSSGSNGATDDGKAAVYNTDGSLKATEAVSIYSGSNLAILTATSLNISSGTNTATVSLAAIQFSNGTVAYGLNSSGIYYNGNSYAWPSGAGTLALVSDIPSLPTATTSVLGGVKVDGTSILITSGTISATAASVGAAPTRSYQTTAFTAAKKGRYACNGTFSVTDPASPSTGDFYDILIEGGSVTVGGTVYSASRFPLHRWYNGSAWVTLGPVITDNLTLNGTHNTASSHVGVTPTTGDLIVYEQYLALHAKKGTRDRALIYSTSFTASGTGATARRTTLNAGQFDGDLSTSATSASYLRFQIVSGSLGGAVPVNTYLIKTDHAWSLWVKSYFTLPANTNFLIGIGCDCSSGVPASGNHIGVIVDSTSRVRLWKCVGGTITYSSDGAISNIPSSGSPTYWHQFWVDVDGSGNASLYVATSTLMSGLADKPSSAVCALASIPTTLDGAQLMQVYRGTGTPGAFCYAGLGDCKLFE